MSDFPILKNDDFKRRNISFGENPKLQEMAVCTVAWQGSDLVVSKPCVI